MAKAKMGAIVTQLAGKLNSHCFRVYRGMQVLQKNGAPPQTNNIANNPAMPIIRDLFTKWNTQSVADRRLWKDIALLYPVNDRWGFPKYLTPREMYTKCNINRCLADGGSVDASVFDGYIPGLEFSSVEINITDQKLFLNDDHLAPDVFLQVCIKRVKGEYINPNPARIKTICYIESGAYSPSDLYHDVSTAGFVFEPNEWYAVSVSAVSKFGMKSPFILGLAQALNP